MTRFQLELADTLDPEVHALLGRELISFNAELLGDPCIRPLAVLIRDQDGKAAGGLSGRTGFQWLYIEFLFVPESMRSTGAGNEILAAAESEARMRGCSGAWLDTLNPAARTFYEKRGYVMFGQLPDYPKGNSRIFLCKHF